MNHSTHIVFTQGGKGGVGKTELMLSLIDWYHNKGESPLLLDFDIENTNKSGLQNFFPDAEKFDVHKEGALDRFLDACDDPQIRVVVADLGSGAGTATYQWFSQVYEDANGLGLTFTSIGVTTNEAGAAQSVLKWARQLQRRVSYLIVLNEFREPDCRFEYWHNEPAVSRFHQHLSSRTITMKSRIQEFQAELRNQNATLQHILDRKTDAPFFKKTRNIVRARAYQRDLFRGFDSAADILLPPAS